MTVVINGTTGITNDGGYTGDGVVFADTTPANTLVTTTGGNVGIGTSSPAYKFQVNSGDNQLVVFNESGTWTANGGVVLADYYAATTLIAGVKISASTATSGYLTFHTGGTTERARIDTSGNWLVGTTDSNSTSGVGLKLIASSISPSFQTVHNTSANNSTYLLYNTNATNNGFRFYVQTNGGIVNFSGNNVNISDERTKKNIEVAGGYLDKICAIPVKLFNYKDEAEGEQRTLGVIAQEVETIAPELVSNDGFGETPEDGIPFKTIYQTDLQYALMKCIQEQQAIITALTARVAALEGTQNV